MGVQEWPGQDPAAGSDSSHAATSVASTLPSVFPRIQRDVEPTSSGASVTSRCPRNLDFTVDFGVFPLGGSWPPPRYRSQLSKKSPPLSPGQKAVGILLGRTQRRTFQNPEFHCVLLAGRKAPLLCFLYSFSSFP